MPIDTSIITRGVAPVQIENPLNRMAQVLQIQNAQQEQGLNALKADEYRRGVADQNKLRELLSAPDADPYKALLGMGKVKEATDYQKGQADIKKTQGEAEFKALETAHKRVDSWGQAMGYVRQNPTPETAVSAVQHLVNMGIMPREQAQAAIASIGQNPTPENITQWATMGFQAALQAKDQLPKYETKNLGGQTITQAIDPVTGQVRQVNALQNTQSPDAQLQAQTSEANNRRTVGAQYANANATREIANATKEAALIGANLKNEELRGKLEDRTRQKEAGVASIAAQIGVIDKALTHPGRKTATGFSSVADPRNFVPGTDASDFRAVLDQIGGAAFLQAFESLKGGGQITEVEGKKATDAIARLSRAQSDTEFERSLRDLREVMASGYARSSGRQFAPAPETGKPQAQAGAPARIASDAEYNALPSGAVFVGPDGKQRRKP